VAVQLIEDKSNCYANHLFLAVYGDDLRLTFCIMTIFGLAAKPKTRRKKKLDDNFSVLQSQN